jgi:hypothetical protein
MGMRASGLIALVCALGLRTACGATAEPQNTAGTAATKNDAPLFIPATVRTRPALINLESREAQVYVRFIVSPRGIPTQLEVIGDRGFHNQTFRDQALQYVRAMRFNPARLEGVAVEYGPVVQTFNFFAGGASPQQGVTPAFRQEMKKVDELMKKGDYIAAGVHADWMLREKVQFIYEFAVLQAELARAHAAAGNKKEALAAVIRATGRNVTETAGFELRAPPAANDPSRYLLPRDLIVSLLEIRMQLYALNGELIQALKTYNEMAGLVKIKADDKRALLAEQLTLLLESGNALAFQGEVTGEYWSHELFRTRFTVRNVKGQLGKVHLHCRGQFMEEDYAPDTSWRVPDRAESCVVEFYGDPGATFELLELPD